MSTQLSNGSPFGCHRVLAPKGVLTLALAILREAPALRTLYQSLYADEVRQ